MAFCEQCGNAINAGARFCGRCGSAGRTVQLEAARHAATPSNVSSDTSWQLVGNPIAVTLSLLIGCVAVAFLAGFDERQTELLAVCLRIGSAIWASLDASRLELSRYKTRLASNAFVLFVVVCVIWEIAFPWYLSVRGRIQRGTLQRDEKRWSNRWEPAGPRSSRVALILILIVGGAATMIAVESYLASLAARHPKVNAPMIASVAPQKQEPSNGKKIPEEEVVAFDGATSVAAEEDANLQRFRVRIEGTIASEHDASHVQYILRGTVTNDSAFALRPITSQVCTSPLQTDGQPDDNCYKIKDLLERPVVFSGFVMAPDNAPLRLDTSRDFTLTEKHTNAPPAAGEDARVTTLIGRQRAAEFEKQLEQSERDIQEKTTSAAAKQALDYRRRVYETCVESFARINAKDSLLPTQKKLTDERFSKYCECMANTIAPSGSEIDEDVRAADDMIMSAWESQTKIPNEAVGELYAGAWTSCVLKVQKRLKRANQ